MDKQIFKVLCVDDDAFMLKAIYRLIRRMRPDWQVISTTNPADWQAECDKNQLGIPDLVISDLLMPKMRGDEVLDEVKIAFPSAVRALLTGDTTAGLSQKAHNYAHFIIPKPFSEDDFEHLFCCVQRLQKMPFTPECRSWLGALTELPILPNSIMRLRKEISSTTSDIHSIAESISHEPALVAHLFRIANSPYFGFRRHTDSLTEAVGRVGSTLVESIAISILTQIPYQRVTAAQHEAVAEQALRVGYISRHLVKQLGFGQLDQDKVFVASLLTSIGTLIFLEESVASSTEFDDELQCVSSLQMGFCDIHVIAAYVLILWGYDIEIGEIILNQKCRDFVAKGYQLLASIVGVAVELEAIATEEECDAILSELPDEVSQAVINLKPLLFD
jgi:HD-like signal output (HDOD) protein